MTTHAVRPVLTETFWQTEGSQIWAKRLLLVVAGVIAMTIAAKIRVPMWPVPITMGTFAVLTIGAAYGPRLGFATILGYMIIGALGFDVFKVLVAKRGDTSLAVALHAVLFQDGFDVLVPGQLVLDDLELGADALDHAGGVADRVAIARPDHALDRDRGLRLRR